MADGIVVTIEGVETPGEVVAPIEAVTETVLEQAIEIAETIVEARKEGEAKAEHIEFDLSMLFGSVESLHNKFETVIGLLESLTDEVATLTALEVAELIEEEPPEVIEEVIEAAETLEPETVPTVKEPAPRIERKKRKWL